MMKKLVRIEMKTSFIYNSIKVSWIKDNVISMMDKILPFGRKKLFLATSDTHTIVKLIKARMGDLDLSLHSRVYLGTALGMFSGNTFSTCAFVPPW